MITGKDKIKFKELEEENEKLKQLMHLKNKAINEDLLNTIKALLYQYKNHEIIIDEKDIEQARRGEIYMMNDMMSFSKRIKLIFKENKLKEEWQWKK